MRKPDGRAGALRRLASSADLHGLGRLDFNVGGPPAENWRFNVGGYYRHDEGVRDPGYPAHRGGQLKLNATRDFKTGYARFYESTSTRKM